MSLPFLRCTCITLVLLAVAAEFPNRTAACTIFSIVRDGDVLMGNSEDFTKRGAIRFVPASEGKLGRVNVSFHSTLGFVDDFAQGSMNEQGLAFDAAVVAKVPWEADPNKETPQNLIDDIMDRCGTVSEAVELFRKFNCPYLAEAQFLFADATGASAVITWSSSGDGLSVVRRDGPVLVATNTRLSPGSYRCVRSVRATRELSATDVSPFDAARNALNAIHQRGPGAFTS